MGPTAEQAERAMIVLGLAVWMAAAAAPGTLQRGFGVPTAEITRAGAPGWRLFATRNL